MPVGLLAGAFGQGNVGDDALLEAFVRALPGWRLAVTTADRAAAVDRGCVPVPAHRSADVGRWTARADAVVIGGGSVFKALHASTGRPALALLTNTAALVTGASILGRPVAMVGVGAGRLAGAMARALARSIVRHADLLVLRDEESVDELMRAGVPGPLRVGADPTWTLLVGSEWSRSVARTSVRLVPSRLAAEPGGVPTMVEALAETVARLTAAGVQVQLQAWQCAAPPGADDDAALLTAVLRRLGRAAARSVEVVPTPSSLPEAAASMAEVGSVLSFRFHALIAASAPGVPWVAVAHEAKLGDLARRLGQRAVPAGAPPTALVAAALDALGGPGPAPAAVKEHAERAEEGFRLLRVLLAQGRSDETDELGALPLLPAPPAS